MQNQLEDQTTMTQIWKLSRKKKTFKIVVKRTVMEKRLRFFLPSFLLVVTDEPVEFEK